MKNPAISATCLRIMPSRLTVGEVKVTSTVPYAWIGYVVKLEMNKLIDVVVLKQVESL